MTNRENYLSLARRSGFERVPFSFSLCPSLAEKFRAFTSENHLDFPFVEGNVPDLPCDIRPPEFFLSNYYSDCRFRPGTNIDGWGVAHEPGSSEAYHMTYMHNPLRDIDSPEQVLAYPMPVYHDEGLETQRKCVEALRAQDRIAVGNMQCTVWETAWYMRGMENLFCDMMGGDPVATTLLDRVTDIAVQRAVSFARAGVDVLFLGDDIGMQRTLLMSETLYDEWLQPRLRRVIDAARAVRPDILVFYHSCGYVRELIPHLIDAGIDVLDPVQPECMDFRELHDRFGDRLSFHGTLGTQTTMPFGTPDDVRRVVLTNLEIAGGRGGLFVCPTHLLEPEVPVENILAYIRACQEFHN